MVDRYQAEDYNEENKAFMQHIAMMKANSYLEMEKIGKESKLMMSAKEAIQGFLNDDEFKTIIMERRKARIAQEAREQGLEQGMLQNQESSALKMIQKGYQIDEIQDITGLSLSQIEFLKKTC